MSRRILGMKTTNWSGFAASRTSRGKGNTSLSRGEYDWDVVTFDASGNRVKQLTIKADDFDEAVKKAQTLVEIGQAVTVDGRRFVK